MIILNKEFLKPSKEARVLSILDSLAIDDGLSQQDLGRQTCLSVAMVNQYLRELKTEDVIRYEPANGKKFRYTITTKGARLREHIFALYSSELIRLYTGLKQSIRDRLSDLRERGIKKVALFGASETCEVVLSAIGFDFFEVVALVDNDSAKHGKAFHGHVVSPPQVLESVNCDAVIITSYGSQEEICRQLDKMPSGKTMEIVRL